MADKVGQVKEILVGEDIKGIQILNPKEVLVAVEVVLVIKVVMLQVQLMDPPLDIPIHNMGHHFFAVMVVLVEMVELSLCLELLP